jgi:hypothetical protein
MTFQFILFERKKCPKRSKISYILRGKKNLKGFKICYKRNEMDKV